MSWIGGDKDTYCICKIDGHLHQYDLATETEHGIYFNTDDFELLGRGTIYTVDGAKQGSQKLLYFWRKKYEYE